VTLRQRQAEATRREISEAAHDLFLEFGYVGTTMDDIAEAAGVARGTIYNLFKSKGAVLVAALHNRVVESLDEARRMDHEHPIDQNDAEAVIDRFVELNRRVATHALPIVAVAYEASVLDGDVAKMLEMQEDLRFDMQTEVRDLADKGLLRTDLSVDFLQRGFWILASPRVVITATRSGWNLDDYSTWLRETLRGLLLPPCGEESP
jgi:AcrR family transcriptional regulator